MEDGCVILRRRAYGGQVRETVIAINSPATLTRPNGHSWTQGILYLKVMLVVPPPTTQELAILAVMPLPEALDP